MVSQGGIFGIILSIVFLFVGLLIFDAFDQNVIDCTSMGTTTSEACTQMKTYAGIAFIIAPIVILLDVVGLLPVFGNSFR